MCIGPACRHVRFWYMSQWTVNVCLCFNSVQHFLVMFQIVMMAFGYGRTFLNDRIHRK